jgi:hypothetical protein
MKQESRSPAELVAIARAAHAVGDRDLERSVKIELRESFGIEIRFPRASKQTTTEAACK